MKNFVPNVATVLENVTLVALDITTWSGAAQLKPGDVPGLSDLPERAFSLGRKYLIAPERLKAFTTLRRRAQDRCLRVGTRLLGGFAVPNDPATIEELYRDLHAIEQEFEAEKGKLIASLGLAIDEWVAEPEVQPFEGLIRSAVPSAQDIEKRLSFRYVPITIAAPATETVAPAGHLDAVAGEMGDTLMGEVAQAARALKDRFLERNKGQNRQDWTFTGQTKRACDGLRKKLSGLCFVDHRCAPRRAKRRRVVPGRRGRVRAPGVAKGRRPEAA